jgi:exopolyphosphatase/pppGpp-phosphohydrolase
MSNPNLRDDFRRSVDLVEVVVKNNFMPFIARGIDELVDHGAAHAEEVLTKIKALCASCSSIVGLSEAETYLLQLTAWLHDIGCIVARERHEKTSCDILERIGTELLLDTEVVRLLRLLILYHRGEAGIAALARRPQDYLFENPVRIDLLVALFRLADACDVGHRSTRAMVGERAPRMVFKAIGDQLSNKSVEHWRAHMNSLGTTIDKRTGHIIVHRRDHQNIDIVLKALKWEIKRVRPVLDKYQLPFTEVIVLDH